MIFFELFEATSPRIVVTYPGRFQPFHMGHHDVFKDLQKTFGPDNVYILTSDKTDNKKSPFNFNDKVVLMTSAGVPIAKIIETSNMYSLPEEFDPKNTIFIAAVGAPDADRLRPDTVTSKDQTDKFGIFKPAGSPSYYQSWTGNQPVTADKHGYVFVVPEKHKQIKINDTVYDVSHGTKCRNLWNTIRNDGSARAQFLDQLYNQATPELASIFDKIPYTSTTEDLSPMGQSTISPISGNTNRLAKMEDAAGVGVIANKKQKNKPQFSTSMTNDVKPGAIQRSLRAFRLAEEITLLENQIKSVKESWSKKYKKSINCNNPKGFSQRAHCASRRARQAGKKTKSSSINESKNNYDYHQILSKFLPIAMKELHLNKLPKLKPMKHIAVHNHQATFGRFLNDDLIIEFAITNRHPLDVLRTLAHELTHYKQYLKKQLNKDSGKTGSPQENEAHAKAGIIMRHFNKLYPNLINL